MKQYIIDFMAISYLLQYFLCHCGEIGRHEGLKIPFSQESIGSSPISGILKINYLNFCKLLVPKRNGVNCTLTAPSGN